MRARATACGCGSASGCSRPRISAPRRDRLRRRGGGQRASSRGAMRSRRACARSRADSARRAPPRVTPPDPVSAGHRSALGGARRLERVLRPRARQPDPARHPVEPPDRGLRLPRRPRAARHGSGHRGRRAPRRSRLHLARAAADAAHRPDRRDRDALRHRHAVALRHGVRRARAGDAPHRRSGPGLEDRHGRHGRMGVIKLGLAFAGDWVRRVVPRAALLGSIAGVAMLLIAFLPSLKVFGDPLVGLVSLIARPGDADGRPCGCRGACRARSPRCWRAALIFWGRWLLGVAAPGPHPPADARRLAWRLPWPTLAWLDALDQVLGVPAARGAVRARHRGRRHRQHRVGARGGRRVPHARHPADRGARDHRAAGCCGGVVQNTPYIGHPAYKAMGARAGYTLATGLVIGVGAAIGVVVAARAASCRRRPSRRS